MLDRRAFVAGALSLLGIPRAAGAQQAARVYRVGLLSMGTIAPQVTMWSAFLDAMHELDYVEGRNLVVRRGAAGDGRPDRLPEFVAGFLRDGVDVIVTTSTRETQAAKRATSTIPIVMTLSPDPVGQGLVASLARPGGNVTGLTNLVPGVSGKYVELLKETAPSASAFVVVTGPRGPFQDIRRDLDLAALRVGVGLSYAKVEGPTDIDRALTQARKDGAGGMIVPLDVVTGMHRQHLARVAILRRLPSIYWQRDYVLAGGLLSYGVSLVDVGRRAAYFVDRVLKGAKPADLPIEQPTKFELVINLKTAKALGLTIPPSVLARADEVIQ
jgi:putative tryptophan/tyrosine transport system substrate-binding protein